MKAVLKKIVVLVAALGTALLIVNPSNVEAKAKTYNVTFIYGSNVSTQQVSAGKSAVVPTNTYVPGFIFAGWTDTAANIQSDKVILGMYTPNGIQPSASKTPTNNPIGGRAIKANNDISAPGCDWWDYSLKGVPGQTCVIRWYNGHSGELWKTEVVPYGTTLDDPGNPCIQGYDFIGWVGSWENITEDRNIMAWYMHTNRTTFKGSDGGTYATFWTHDQQAATQASNPGNISGYTFVGWTATQGNLNYATGDIVAYPQYKDNDTGEIVTGYPSPK